MLTACCRGAQENERRPQTLTLKWRHRNDGYGRTSASCPMPATLRPPFAGEAQARETIFHEVCAPPLGAFPCSTPLTGNDLLTKAKTFTACLHESKSGISNPLRAISLVTEVQHALCHHPTCTEKRFVSQNWHVWKHALVPPRSVHSSKLIRTVTCVTGERAGGGRPGAAGAERGRADVPDPPQRRCARLCCPRICYC